MPNSLDFASLWWIFGPPRPGSGSITGRLPSSQCGGGDEEGRKEGRNEGEGGGGQVAIQSMMPPPSREDRAISDNFSKLVFRRFTASDARSIDRRTQFHGTKRERVVDPIGFAIYLDIAIFRVLTSHVVKRTGEAEVWLCITSRKYPMTKMPAPLLRQTFTHLRLSFLG